MHAYLDSSDQTTDSITSYINLSREYIIRWNPINTTFNSDVIFTIPSMSYALVVCDFRALQTEYENFTYYEDWGVSFTIADSISTSDRAIPVQMPELFLRTQNVKNEVQEFEIFAWVTKQLRVDILLYNGLYINLKNMFLNTWTVEIREPYRTTYSTNNIFIALIQNSYQIGLPINAPQLRQDDATKSPDYSVTLASNNNFTISKSVSNRVVTSRGKNIYVPDSLYWQGRDSIILPYFPFFSNWKGYGQYIPIWAVNEQNTAWTLVSVNETISMSEYAFSARPNSDNWNSIIIQWVYDEVFDDGQQSLTRWFEVQNQGSIYDIYADPVSADDAEYYSVDQNSILTFSPTTSSGGDLSNAPQEIDIEIDFYQFSETDKKIITVSFEFANMKALTSDEQNGLIDVAYNVSYTYSSMTHTQLIIAFAFQWHFYFVLYLIIGASSVTIALIFLLYHRLVARGKNLSFKFFTNLKLTEPPVIWGMILAHIPLWAINLWMCVMMIGHVLTNKTELFPWDSSVAPAQCPFSIFDFMPDDPNNVSIDYSLLRTGRIAVSFIVVGAYCVVIGLIIVIPDKNIKGEYYTAESFDGNVWEFFTWKRSNVLLVSLFWIFFLLCIIQFSFSSIYSLYIWYMIVTIKGLNIAIGFIIELMLEDSIVCSTLDILGGLTGGLVTFGASDFVSFLQSYYVDFGMQMFERTYLGDVTDTVLDFVKEKGEKLIEMKNSWFSNQDDIFDKEMKEKEERMKRKRLEQEEKLLAENTDAKGKTEEKKAEEKKGGEMKEEKKNEALDDLDAASSGSDIYISDEDDFDFDDSDNIDDSDQLVDYDNDSDANDKKKAEQKNKGEKDHKKGKKEKESDIAFDENIEVFEVEPILDKFKDYAGDNIELYINPLFTMILWLFYDETQIANSYGIKTQDFVYYVMFALVFIPFQVTIDMLFLNISEWFFKLPIHDYLDYLHFRFATRTSRWKGNEIVVNKQVDEENILLDQLWFSSQYYFIQTIMVFGMIQLMLGINTLLTFPSYNLFADMGILLVVVALIAVCFLIHRFWILLGRIFCIWKIKEVKTQKKETTLKDEFLKILNVEQYMKNKGIKLTPVELHFSPEKWDIVEKLRGQDEIALIDLQTDRIVAKTVRDKFIRYNKPWLRENMHEIFTPRTLFLYRKEIINQFEKVVGKRQPANISLSSKEKSTFSKEASGSKDTIFQRNFNPTLLNERTIPVIKFWIARAKNIKKIRRYVSRIIDSSMDKECMFWGSTYGLMVKTLENIEDTFHDFLKITGYSIANYKVVVWQRYFKIATTFKTVCSVGECADENRINFRNMQVLAKQNANKSKV